MVDIRNDTHTVRLDWATIVYWRDNSACGQDDPWTRCEVSPAGAVSGYPYFTSSAPTSTMPRPRSMPSSSRSKRESAVAVQISARYSVAPRKLVDSLLPRR